MSTHNICLEKCQYLLDEKALYLELGLVSILFSTVSDKFLLCFLLYQDEAGIQCHHRNLVLSVFLNGTSMYHLKN